MRFPDAMFNRTKVFKIEDEVRILRIVERPYINHSFTMKGDSFEGTPEVTRALKVKCRPANENLKRAFTNKRVYCWGFRGAQMREKNVDTP